MDELSADDYDEMVASYSADSEEETGLPNVEQCQDDMAQGAKIGAAAGGIGAIVEQVVAAAWAGIVATPAAVVAAIGTVVAMVAGGAVTGAATAAMTSDACAAAPQELGEFVDSQDPSQLEKQMEKISLSTAPMAFEGR